MSASCPFEADPAALEREAAWRRDAAVEHARAAEHLIRAALAINAVGPDQREAVIAWNREADDLLERSLAFHADAFNLETLAERRRT